MELPETFPAAPPKAIYLQYYGDQDPRDAEGEPSEVTWCADKIFKHDLKYVRAGRSAGRDMKTIKTEKANKRGSKVGVKAARSQLQPVDGRTPPYQETCEHGIHYDGQDCFACHPDHPSIGTLRWLLSDEPSAPIDRTHLPR